MSNLQHFGNNQQQDYQTLINEWLEAEQNGTEFPVPFEQAWQIAGYSRKDSAKRKLTGKRSPLIENEDYLVRKGDFHKSVDSSLSGSSGDSISLSCDAFKHLCLMAETEQGRQIRQYFIEAEKQWRMVEQQQPEYAKEIEMQKLRNEELQLEAQKAQAEAQKTQAELSLTQFRHSITQTCPEPVQQKILGYQQVEKVEYRDRVFRDDELLRSGETINKTELCHRYRILTNNGKPNYKRLNELLNSAELPEDAFEGTYSIRENKELKREYLSQLDALFTESNRNLFLGE